MGIRLPLQTVLDVQNNGLLGAASVSGGIANTFTIPQDADNVVVKMTASTVGGGVSTILQTSDDGGTTWYDVARTSIVSNANATNAEWLSSPVIGIGVRTGFISPASIAGAVGSIIGFGSVYGAIGRAPASALGQLAVTGLPILGQLARTFMIVGAGVTTVNSVVTQVKVNSQSVGTN